MPMDAPILGLHHVTATVAHAQEDLDFFAGLLGLRLVKRTVNFDNHGVYHFYYGDERGTPGSLFTTFPYAGMGVRTGTKGAGQVTATAFSIPAGSLAAWRSRFASAGMTLMDAPPRFGEEVVVVEDPSGLRLELLAADTDPRDPWVAAGIANDSAIRGLHSVTLTIRDPAATLELLVETLGYRIVAGEGGRTRLAAGPDLPGHYLDVLHETDATPGINGIGTVHHVAMAIATPDQQLELRSTLLGLGLQVTEVRDRHYFRSIYFREPGGVLYEVATVNPGFTVDEDPSHLGLALRLPPSEETSRASIEATLPTIRVPGA